MGTTVRVGAVLGVGSKISACAGAVTRRSGFLRKLIGKSGTRNFGAFQQFAVGLDQLDAGSTEAAKNALAKALDLDPSFQAARSRLDSLEERVLQLEGAVEGHDKQIDMMTDGMAGVLELAARKANDGDREVQFMLGYDSLPLFGQHTTTWGAPRGKAAALKWLTLSADSLKSTPLLAMMPTG